MDIKEALLLVADWVDEGLESGRLDHYYWGYNETSDELRKAASEIG